MSEQQSTEKSDTESGYASATPHSSSVQDALNVKVKREYDSDSDIEIVSEYTLGEPNAPKPPKPPMPSPSEYHDLTMGSDGEWDLFIEAYFPGDQDIKPIIKMENPQ